MCKEQKYLRSDLKSSLYDINHHVGVLSCLPNQEESIGSSSTVIGYHEHEEFEISILLGSVLKSSLQGQCPKHTMLDSSENTRGGT